MCEQEKMDTDGEGLEEQTSYKYLVASAQNSNGVVSSVAGNFRIANERDLVVAYTKRIEQFSVKDGILHQLRTVSVLGRVIWMAAFRFSDEVLFIV